MSVYEYIIGAVLIVFSLLIIAVVLFQEGRQANLGVISGAADSFLDKSRARTWDARLARWTKVIAITFFVLVFVGMLVTRFLSPMALASYKSKAAAADAATTTVASDTTTDTTSVDTESTTATTVAAE